MVKLLVINVTLHTPQNAVSNTIMHVTLNTINNAVERQMSWVTLMLRLLMINIT